MADKYRKARPGSPLAIPHQLYNELIDHLRRSHQHPRQLARMLQQQAGVVLIKNNSGTLRSRFNVLGISDALISPTANLGEFQERPMLVGITPDIELHTGKFAVLFEPLAQGEIGRAVISGLAIVQVDVLDADHGWAEMKDDDATQLQSRDFGSARIVYKESSTGTKWAIVHLGVQPRAMFPVLVFQAGGDAGNFTTPCSLVYNVTDLSGYTIGASMTPAKFRPPYGAMLAPADGSYGTGFYAADGNFVLFDANEVLDTGDCVGNGGGEN